MPKLKLNVRLLKKMKKHILEEPRRFIMGTWRYDGMAGTTIDDYSALFRLPKCGTAACFGGWALILSNKRVTGNIARRAQKLLGLPNGDLFGVGTWPEPFRETFIYATNPRKRATIATELIDKVIATKGAILGSAKEAGSF